MEARKRCFALELNEKEVIELFEDLSKLYLGGVFNKTIIPLEVVGYEMIIANLALRTSLAIYHLISNARLWNKLLLIMRYRSDVTI